MSSTGAAPRFPDRPSEVRPKTNPDRTFIESFDGTWRSNQNDPYRFSSSEFQKLLSSHGGHSMAIDAYFVETFGRNNSLEYVLNDVQKKGDGDLNSYADYVNSWHECSLQSRKSFFRIAS
jgi:hypothetical protein